MSPALVNGHAGGPSNPGTYSSTQRRGPIAAEFQGPGPAAVALPSTIGKSTSESTKGRAPAFSFGVRYKEGRTTLGPGPGQYNVAKLHHKGKDEGPAPSLSGRPKEEKKEITPAPGAYSPEKGEKFVAESSPSFTFGAKVKAEPKDNLPGPGAYESGNPDKYKARSPSYSISSRTNIPTDHTQKPGPGAHCPEKVKLDASPAHTFGVKHSPYLGKLKGC